MMGVSLSLGASLGWFETGRRAPPSSISSHEVDVFLRGLYSMLSWQPVCVRSGRKRGAKSVGGWQLIRTAARLGRSAVGRFPWA